MKYIEFKGVQAAREGLSEQISILRKIKEELGKPESVIRDMTGMEEALYLMDRIRSELEEEIRAYQGFAQCLEEIVQICQKTERRITERYDMEQTVYPKTEFCTSRITGFGSCGHLITFR